MTLLDWQKRLTSHFECLAGVRTSDNKRGVFVLEHGLDGTELTALQAAVRSAAKTRGPDATAPLPWLVYATEIGYRYSGDQYWQTFEEETPGWAGFWDRRWLREQFLWFHSKFHGIQPIGSWAQHRSIICWPIANAILPRDLQLQLVRILYEMRYTLNSDLFRDPERLGREIARRSWIASTRMQNLCEEFLLIGQIATALLLEGKGVSSSLILPVSLLRISTDLNREQQSRDFLRKARGVAKERLNVRGTAQGSFPDKHESEGVESLKRVSFEPRFLLRPPFAEKNSWCVFLEIPSLDPFMELIPESRSVLRDSRCEVAGGDGRPLVQGRLLKGTQRIPLVSWPKPGQPLLSFEKRDIKFDQVLQIYFSMGTGPVWLFRIASDGMAYELKGAGVRTGEKYILLRYGVGPIPPIPYARPIKIDCEGIQGVLLEIPEAFTSQAQTELQRVGVGVAKNIRLWPAGVDAIVWDGEGRGEWLATESPCFAIKSDHALSALAANVGGKRIELGQVAAGGIVFASFQNLLPGNHIVQLYAKEGPFTAERNLGRLEIFLRPARAWEVGKGNQGPLLVDVDPLNPTLEQLRESKVDVNIRGPIGRELGCTVRLFRKGHETAVFSRTFPKIKLPVTTENWNHYLRHKFFEIREVEELYDSCSSCDFILNAEELGSLTLRFEGASAPVRWATRMASGRRKQITLVSDAALDQPVRIIARKFETPDIEELCDPSRMTAWWDVPSHGGLFMAMIGKITAAVIVPPEVHSLADLQFNLKFSPKPRTLKSLLEILADIRLWASARLTGNFISESRQHDVLRALTKRIHILVGKETEGHLDESLSSWVNTFQFHGYQGNLREEMILARLIRNEAPKLVNKNLSERVEWFYVNALKALGYHRTWKRIFLRDGSKSLVLHGLNSPADPQWLSEFALRLASNPNSVESWSGDSMQSGLKVLLGNPSIARLARFLVLLVSAQVEVNSQDRSVYQGWGWR